MTVPEKPEKTAGDTAHALAKAALSAIPAVGGSAAELFAFIVTPPLEKRRDKWFQQVADAVEELQKKAEGLTPESLSKNDTFISTLLKATQVASRTHQQVKLDALRNAVVSAAMPDAPDDTMQQIFLTYVDDLTVWHLRILAFFLDPAVWFSEKQLKRPNIKTGAKADILEAGMPELNGRRAFYDLIVSDLQTRALLGSSPIHQLVSESGLYAAHTTAVGNDFLKFISKR